MAAPIKTVGDKATTKPSTWANIANDGNSVNVSVKADGWIRAGDKVGDVSEKLPVQSSTVPMSSATLDKSTLDKSTLDKSTLEKMTRSGKNSSKVETPVKVGGPGKDLSENAGSKEETSDNNETIEHGDDVKDTKNVKYPVYIVFSKWSMLEIENFLLEYADSPNQIGSVRIDYFHNKETDRTIVLMDPSVYKKITKKHVVEGLRKKGFSISPYEIRSHWYPRESEGETSDFYIHLPKHLTVDKCRTSLQAKIDELILFGILDSSSVSSISIPLESRESINHIGRAYIDFKEGTDKDSIAFARVILSYSKWSHKNSAIKPDEDDNLKCFYKKSSQKKKASNGPNSAGFKTESKKSKPKATIKVPTVKTENKFSALPTDEQ